MKKKNAKTIAAAFAVACALVMNVTTVSAGNGGFIKKIVEMITGESETPCWYMCEFPPEGCCHCFLYCPTCSIMEGIPRGPQGTC